TIAVGAMPQGISADADSDSVWVANTLDGTVSNISITSNAVVGVVAAGHAPTGVFIGVVPAAPPLLAVDHPSPSFCGMPITAPLAQTLAITNGGGAGGVTFTATTDAGGGNWLNVTPSSGT